MLELLYLSHDWALKGGPTPLFSKNINLDVEIDTYTYTMTIWKYLLLIYSSFLWRTEQAVRKERGGCLWFLLWLGVAKMIWEFPTSVKGVRMCAFLATHPEVRQKGGDVGLGSYQVKHQKWNQTLYHTSLSRKYVSEGDAIGF